MADVVTFILYTCFVLFCGWKLREWYAKYIIKKYLEANEKVAEAVMRTKLITLDLKKINDIIYVYNDKTQEFITQVKTYSELVDFFQTKHSDCYVTLKAEQKILFEGTE